MSYKCDSFLEFKVQCGWGKGEAQGYFVVGGKSTGMPNREVKQHTMPPWIQLDSL